MKKLRWVMDGGGGGFWDLDVSTPITLDGVARPVPLGYHLPLGVSRGATLSRPKQIDFFQRFMFAPFVPSYSPRHHGFSLQRLLSFPFPHFWFASLLGQFNLQKFVSSLGENGLQPSESSWPKTIAKHLCNKAFYALNFCSELLITPDDTFLFSVKGYGDKKIARKKAVLHHKASKHLVILLIAYQLFLADETLKLDLPFLFFLFSVITFI